MSMSSDFPADAVAAATHSDPYPYYARLVAERPMHRDDRLGAWVAASATAVTEVLTSSICRVRPPAEPVPRAIDGSPAGEIFRHLVRMNDGAMHCPFKRAIVGTLGSLDSARLDAVAVERSATLAERLAPEAGGENLRRFMFPLPVHVVATLLGVPSGRIDEVAAWVEPVVTSFTPIATAEDIEQGKVAAAHLLALFADMLAASPRSLLGVLAAEARRAGIDADATIVANGVGFLTQTYEATAGLVGNALVTLAAQESARKAVLADPDLIPSAVLEVLRYDPPTQSTRRFLAEDGVIAGQAMRAGDTIVVLLGAAARDPALNPDPDRFDLHRADRRILNFGAGPHACPADRLAPRIAGHALAALLPRIDFARLTGRVRYRRSAALRIPLFDAAGS